MRRQYSSDDRNGDCSPCGGHRHVDMGQLSWRCLLNLCIGSGEANAYAAGLVLKTPVLIHVPQLPAQDRSCKIQSDQVSEAVWGQIPPPPGSLAGGVGWRFSSQYRIQHLPSEKEPDRGVLSIYLPRCILGHPHGKPVDGSVCTVWNECNLYGPFWNIDRLGTLPNTDDYDRNFVWRVHGRVDIVAASG